MTKNVLVWWLFFCLQAFGAAIAYYYGIFGILQVADPTYISFAILTLHSITVIWLGFLTYRKDNSNNEILWFISETQLGLGMLGTLIGFIIMFSGVFGHEITPDNLKDAIASIAVGVSTAIWTTLVGLASGLILKTLIINLERTNGGQK